MKRDIRELFTEEDDLKTLPQHHREEFLERLKKQSKPKQNLIGSLSVAAILIIALTIGFNNIRSKPEPISPILAQIEAVEAVYLEDIEAEWQSFIAIADDEVLIARFKEKLQDLDTDYQEISSQFKTDTNNILVLESLVENLQNRLQILKDIQSQIKLINQKKEQYENSI